MEEAQFIPEEENTEDHSFVRFCLSTIIFVLCWCGAIGWIAFPDAVALCLFIVFAVIGGIRGGLAEGSGFLAVLLFFILAINYYKELYEWTQLGFGLGWAGQFAWIVLIVILGWGSCFGIAFFYEERIEERRMGRWFNCGLGYILGLAKGALVTYGVMVIVILGSFDGYLPSGHALTRTRQHLWIVHKLATQLREMNGIYVANSLAHRLFANDRDCIAQAGEILLWIYEEPERLQRLPQIPDAQRIGRQFYEIQEARFYYENSVIVQKAKAQPGPLEWNDLRQILEDPATAQLAKIPQIKRLLRTMNLEQIQKELEES